MSKKLIYLMSTVMALSLLAGCNKKDKDSSGGGDSFATGYDYNQPGEDEVVDQMQLPSNVTHYELDETDYSKLDEGVTDMIRVYYHRDDSDNEYANYFPWRIWAWDEEGGNGWWYEFTKYNAYGVIAEIPVSAVAANGKSINKMGIVITTCSSQTATWTGSYSKDPDSDLHAEISPNNRGGVQRIYCKTKTANVFYSEEAVFMSTLNYAYYKDMKTIRMVFATQRSDFKVYKPRIELKINGKDYTDYELSEFKEPKNYQSAVNLDLKEEVRLTDDVSLSYRISSQNISKARVLPTTIYDGEDFIKKYNYQDEDLGVTLETDKTTFKVWSPVSSSMKVNIYNTGDYRTEEKPVDTIDMTLGEHGVWSATVDQNLANKYYTYTVKNMMGENEVVDPYAKSAGLNGRRGMIVDFEQINTELMTWDADECPEYGNPVDASVYEIHVRDMTINPNSGVEEAYRGKFLGLAQSGTRYSFDNVEVTTGLDHIAELGVTHVQIQPFYDYSSVDETTMDTTMGDDNYNWGYDPLNYNCLEGSYSTDPTDGAVRIKEFKKMVMAFHNKGINIIMDVVYNHTSALESSNFEKLVPYYYHRTKTSGVAYNGSGCGNEMASDRIMVNKFMRESIKFWTEEYHLGGYRFDLMGLMDNQVMIDIYQDAKAINDDIIIYGEPWTGGSTKLKGGVDANKLTEQQTNQNSLAQSFFVGEGNLVGAFSDGIRNAIRGDNAPGQGYVNGNGLNADYIAKAGMKGLFNANQNTVEPSQVINYVSCHDNYTLFDQLVKTISDGNRLNQAYKQAEMMVFTAQGIPFMQEGEDFMRTKFYEGKYYDNSYNVGDNVNNMDYLLKIQNNSMFEFFKGLINLRKNAPALRLPTREDINTNIIESKAENGNVMTRISLGGHEYVIIHAARSRTYNFDSECEILFANDTFAEYSVTSLNLNANTSIVLYKE